MLPGGEYKLIHAKYLEQCLGYSKYIKSVILFFLNEMNGEVVFNSELFAPRIGCITCIITFLNMKEKNSCANMYV